MPPAPAPRIVVAIPAKDEADRIGDCLHGLARQSRRPDLVLLLANNCTDATAAIATAIEPLLPYRLICQAHAFPAASAHAGSARRRAMQRASAVADDDAVLLTTDADSIAAENWIERNMLAVSRGADLVCGCIDLDPVEAARIPAHLHADDALECELIELQDRIAAQLDPDAADPWPRHTQAAGASLAVTQAAFQRVGGIPALPSGEDRAFVQALAYIDARIRHDPTVRVTVSGRIEGRAQGGMADAIRRRMQRQDEFTDAYLEPSVDAYRRLDFRRRARAAWQARAVPEELAVDLGIPAARLCHMLNSRFFGTAWCAIQVHSAVLIRRRVRFADLPREIDYARQLLSCDMSDALVPR